MATKKATVGIFTIPQQFPCGPGSSCCGPVGQTEEEVATLKAAIERLGVDVQVHDATNAEVVRRHPKVAQLLGSFGAAAVPIVTVGDQVVCMGRSTVAETVKAVEGKVAAV